MTILYLIRGLPGSGKSTRAKELLRMGLANAHFEADMFFVNDGVYEFDPKRLGEAHRWCLYSAYAKLLTGNDVVVSNTFTTMKEIRPYLELGYPVEIIECTGNYTSDHNVPLHTMKSMRSRYEKI